MPPPDLGVLVAGLSEQANVAVVIEAVEGDSGSNEVPGWVRRCSEQIASPARRADFVRGRLARARALRRACCDPGWPLAGGLPSAETSLTHAGGWAFAVVAASSAGPDRGPGGLIGLGIDFEPAWRGLSEDAGRFFLSSSELAALGGASCGNTRLLSLWTIKEACFKADPTNCHRQLIDYEMLYVSAEQGSVRHPSAFQIRYVSHWCEVGPIAVAAAMSRALPPFAHDAPRQGGQL